MKHAIITLLIAVAALLALAGCKSVNNLTKGISEKSISGSGTVVISRVGLDKTNQTPELFNVFVWGDYASHADGDDVIRYEVSEDASIFNSNAKSNKIKLLFMSDNKARVDKVLDAVTSDIQSRTQTGKEENAASAETPPAKTE